MRTRTTGSSRPEHSERAPGLVSPVVGGFPAAWSSRDLPASLALRRGNLIHI